HLRGGLRHHGRDLPDLARDHRPSGSRARRCASVALCEAGPGAGSGRSVTHRTAILTRLGHYLGQDKRACVRPPRPRAPALQAGPATTGGPSPARLILRGRNTAKTAGRGRTSTTFPPSATAMRRARARPRPVPPGLLLTLRSKI